VTWIKNVKTFITSMPATTYNIQQVWFSITGNFGRVYIIGGLQ